MGKKQRAREGLASLGTTTQTQHHRAVTTHRVGALARAGALKLLPPAPGSSGLAESLAGANLRLRTGGRDRELGPGLHAGVAGRGKERLKGVVESRHEEERPGDTRGQGTGGKGAMLGCSSAEGDRSRWYRRLNGNIFHQKIPHFERREDL